MKFLPYVVFLMVAMVTYLGLGSLVGIDVNEDINSIGMNRFLMLTLGSLVAGGIAAFIVKSLSIKDVQPSVDNYAASEKIGAAKELATLPQRGTSEADRQMAEQRLGSVSANIWRTGEDYFSHDLKNLESEVKVIGESCQLNRIEYLQGTGQDIQSNYRASALILLATYPTDSIPWTLRHFPRPHGGRIWRAIADIDSPLQDAVVNVLLSRDIEIKYPGLQAFCSGQEGFLAVNTERTRRAAEAWVALLLAQENIVEARKLYQGVVKNCSIRRNIETTLSNREPEIAKYIVN